MAKSLQPLEAALQRYKGVAAVRVAGSKQPGFLAFLTAMLRWPDREQPSQFILGYPIVGDISPSGIFRSVTCKDQLQPEEWLGPAAEEAIKRLERSGPPRFHEDILAITREEQQKMFCSDFYCKQDLDRKFGVGGWRPLERFMIVQPCGKKRIIDNARKTQHNAATGMHETIWTINVDFIATCVKQLATRMGYEDPDHWSTDHPWLQFRIGTDDLPNAYRGLAVQDSHLRYSVVAVWVPDQGWQYSIMFGLAYGLEAAVVAFNRLPQVGVAAARRCTLALTAAYFDDELSLECIHDADVSQRGLTAIFTALGITPQKAKCFRPCPDRHYLGASIHLGQIMVNGTMRVQPKFSTVSKIQAKLDDILNSGVFPRDTAGKLRGDLTWMSTMIAGHLGRLANPIMNRYQHAEHPELQDADRPVLEWLRIFTSNAQPRELCVCGPLSPPLIVSQFHRCVIRTGPTHLRLDHF